MPSLPARVHPIRTVEGEHGPGVRELVVISPGTVVAADRVLDRAVGVEADLVERHGVVGPRREDLEALVALPSDRHVHAVHQMSMTREPFIDVVAGPRLVAVRIARLCLDDAAGAPGADELTEQVMLGLHPVSVLTALDRRAPHTGPG